MGIIKYKGKKAFTLIEVVVATSILMISVFGVYKLIGENMKIINNNGNYLQLHSLFPTLEACIDKIGYTSFGYTFPISVGKNEKYDFGNDMNGCTNTSSSGKIILDNVEYSLSSKVLSGGTDFIDFELKISGEGIGTYTGSYRLLK